VKGDTGDADTKCPKCGEAVDLQEKDTSSGRDMRTHLCGRRGAIRNAIHVHDWRESRFATPRQEKKCKLHGYKLRLYEAI